MPHKQKENIVLPKSSPADRALKRKLIGALIREKREARDITIENFAYETGISRSNLIRVENGNNPSIETLLIILYGLSISEVEFYTIIQGRFTAAQKTSDKNPNHNSVIFDSSQNTSHY